MAGDDQMNFLKMLSDYRMAQSKVTNMETEYKIMIKEGSAMVEKDRSMARAEADAVDVAYNTIAKEITVDHTLYLHGQVPYRQYIKRLEKLVNPMMSIAVVAGYGEDNLTVRIHVPNNVQRPKRGDILSVVRPGFSKDVYRVKITGVGSTLDDTGSYMADALLLDRTIGLPDYLSSYRSKRFGYAYNQGILCVVGPGRCSTCMGRNGGKTDLRKKNNNWPYARFIPRGIYWIK